MNGKKKQFILSVVLSIVAVFGAFHMNVFAAEPAVFTESDVIAEVSESADATEKVSESIAATEEVSISAEVEEEIVDAAAAEEATAAITASDATEAATATITIAAAATEEATTTITAAAEDATAAITAAGPTSASEAGLELLKRFEDCRLTAYKVLSTEKYYTIGWGHYGADVYKGMTITQEQADEMLINDVKVYEGYLNTFLSKNNISANQAQYDALLSFTYNLGNIWASSKYQTFQLKTFLINGVQNYTDEQIRDAFTGWNR